MKHRLVAAHVSAVLVAGVALAEKKDLDWSYLALSLGSIASEYESGLEADGTGIGLGGRFALTESSDTVTYVGGDWGAAKLEVAGSVSRVRPLRRLRSIDSSGFSAGLGYGLELVDGFRVFVDGGYSRSEVEVAGIGVEVDDYVASFGARAMLFPDLVHNGAITSHEGTHFGGVRRRLQDFRFSATAGLTLAAEDSGGTTTVSVGIQRPWGPDATLTDSQLGI